MFEGTEMNQNFVRPKLDREYSTQWRREVEFLSSKGIEYVFAKRTGKFAIVTYKYTKTPKLFLALAEFYNQQQYQSNLNAIERVTNTIYPKSMDPKMSSNEMPIEKGYIEVTPDEHEKVLLQKNELNEKYTPEQIREAYENLKDDTV